MGLKDPHVPKELTADTSSTAHTEIEFVLNSIFHSELYLYFKTANCKTLMRHNCPVIFSVPTAELW